MENLEAAAVSKTEQGLKKLEGEVGEIVKQTKAIGKGGKAEWLKGVAEDKKNRKWIKYVFDRVVRK
jgi:predicted HAD superfamily phosphohydrolase